jgi:hypothetical protein
MRVGSWASRLATRPLDPTPRVHLGTPGPRGRQRRQLDRTCLGENIGSRQRPLPLSVQVNADAPGQRDYAALTHIAPPTVPCRSIGWKTPTATCEMRGDVLFRSGCCKCSGLLQRARFSWSICVTTNKSMWTRRIVAPEKLLGYWETRILAVTPIM